MPVKSRSRPRTEAKAAGIAARLPARLLAPFAQRPAETIACAVFAALMAGVLINALAFQNARHPSPLFGTPLALPPQAETPKPVPRPVAINNAPVAAPRARDVEPAPAKAPDAIGDMLRTAPAGSAAPPANTSAIDPTRVLLVQKALMKLGYILRPDGVMGTTTRQAIEKFERERGWPARGELTPKVLREIAARSGFSLE